MMEDIKRRFANDIAALLAGAAESDAKSEMIEELAENLAGRFADMTAAGKDPEAAYEAAMGELGDVNELTAYLNSLEEDGADERARSAAGSIDELFQALGGMTRTAVQEGKKAVNRVMDSDVGRTAIQEAKKAVKASQDMLRRLRDSGAAWKGRTVIHVTVDEADEAAETDEPSGAAPESGWEENSIPSQNVTAIDIETVDGDVRLFVDPDENAPMRLEGAPGRLTVTVTEDGTLLVRCNPTASNDFFFARGFSSSANVDLTVPGKHYRRVRVASASGDMDLGDGLETDDLVLHAASGDVMARLNTCARARVKTASGDIDLRGAVTDLRVDTASGDVDMDGPVGQAAVVTMSGDVEFTGSVAQAQVKTMSGDVTVSSMTLPQSLELSSKSGDVEARVPDAGPFAVQLRSVSGDVDYRFPREWADAAPAEDRPRFTLASISGDVTLRKY